MIAAGGSNTCAATAAGSVTCWGDNGEGQVGNGTTSDKTSPGVPVSGLTGVAAISSMYNHTCVITSDAHVQCWGRWYGTNPIAFTAPTIVPGLSDVSAIAAGETHTCALIADGTVECWGANWNGQLGNGTLTDSPTPVQVTGITGATAIGAGYEDFLRDRGGRSGEVLGQERLWPAG